MPPCTSSATASPPSSSPAAEILQAQARLGHADAATTLREYAYALPLTDRNVADAIDHHLDHLNAERDSDPVRDDLS